MTCNNLKIHSQVYRTSLRDVRFSAEVLQTSICPKPVRTRRAKSAFPFFVKKILFDWTALEFAAAFSVVQCFQENSTNAHDCTIECFLPYLCNSFLSLTMFSWTVLAVKYKISCIHSFFQPTACGLFLFGGSGWYLAAGQAASQPFSGKNSVASSIFFMLWCLFTHFTSSSNLDLANTLLCLLRSARNKSDIFWPANFEDSWIGSKHDWWEPNQRCKTFNLAGNWENQPGTQQASNFSMKWSVIDVFTDSTVQHSTVRHSTAQHGIARYGTV